MDDKNLVPAGAEDIGAAFGAAGFGEFAQEIRFPYLSIAAKGTDLAIEGSPKYIEGLKPGYFFNSLTKRVYGKTIKVIILSFQTAYAEYQKSDKGGRGDFVRRVPDDEVKSWSQAQILDYTKHFLPNGNLLDVSKLFHVVLPDFKDDGIMQLQISKGGFKHVRNWGNMVIRTGEPYPAHTWEVATGMMDDGDYSWFSIGDNSTTFVKDLGRIDKSILGDVKEAFELVSSLKGKELPPPPKDAQNEDPAF